MTDAPVVSEAAEVKAAPVNIPMTGFQKTMVALVIVLIVAVVASIVTYLVVEHNTARQIELDACEEYGYGTLDYSFCVEMVD